MPRKPRQHEQQVAERMTAARLADDFAIAAYARDERFPCKHATPWNARSEDERAVHPLIGKTQCRACRLVVAEARVDDFDRHDELANRRCDRFRVVCADVVSDWRLQTERDLTLDQDPVERATRKRRRTLMHTTRGQWRRVGCRAAT